MGSLHGHKYSETPDVGQTFVNTGGNDFEFLFNKCPIVENWRIICAEAPTVFHLHGSQLLYTVSNLNGLSNIAKIKTGMVDGI